MFFWLSNKKVDEIREEVSVITPEDVDAFLLGWHEWQRQLRSETADQLCWGDLTVSIIKTKKKRLSQVVASKLLGSFRRQSAPRDLMGDVISDPVTFAGAKNAMVWSLADFLRHWVETGMDLNNVTRSVEAVQQLRRPRDVS